MSELQCFSLRRPTDGVTARRAVRFGWLLLASSLACSTARATLFVQESVAYTAGATLKDRNGGTGFSSAWSGDSEPLIATSGLLYADSLGNTLNTAGNAVRNSTDSLKKGERNLSTTYGANGTSIWMSILIRGAAGARQTNVALADKFFIGQGSNSATNTDWTIYDQDGLKFDSGVLASASTSLLVALVEFNAGNETAWLWRNPNLNATPAKSAALNGLSGSNIKEFTFDKVEFYSNRNNDGIIDELRIASTFAEAAPFTPVPEASPTLLASLVSGLVGVAAVWRRRCRSGLV